MCPLLLAMNYCPLLTQCVQSPGAVLHYTLAKMSSFDTMCKTTWCRAALHPCQDAQILTCAFLKNLTHAQCHGAVREIGGPSPAHHTSNATASVMQHKKALEATVAARLQILHRARKDQPHLCQLSKSHQRLNLHTNHRKTKIQLIATAT